MRQVQRVGTRAGNARSTRRAQWRDKAGERRANDISHQASAVTRKTKQEKKKRTPWGGSNAEATTGVGTGRGRPCPKASQVAALPKDAIPFGLFSMAHQVRMRLVNLRRRESVRGNSCSESRLQYHNATDKVTLLDYEAARKSVFLCATGCVIAPILHQTSFLISMNMSIHLLSMINKCTLHKELTTFLEYKKALYDLFR